MQIKKVGVVGCGLMGGGIAQVSAQSGYATVVSEVNEEFLNRGLNAIKGRLARDVEKGRMTAEAQQSTLERLKGTTSLQDFAGCDLVVEAVVENLEEKKKLFSALDKLLPAHSIIASNTSSLCVTEMAAVTQRGERVMGTHFFNPVPIMKLLEISRTLATSDDTVATVKAFGESLGKTVILAKDRPGFIVNRLLVPFLVDAMRTYEEGLATREDIDNGMVLGCNHPMGPLTLADFLGLDTVYYIANIMFDEFKEPRFAPPPILKRLVLQGHLGRKTGKGFYEYK